MRTLTDAAPCADRDASLVREMGRRLLDSIEYMTCVAENVTSHDYSATKASLDCARVRIEQPFTRLRGSIYSVHFALRDAMKAGDTAQVRRLLAGIPGLQLVTDSFLCGTLSWQAMDADVFRAVLSDDFRRTYEEHFDATAVSVDEVGVLRRVVDSVMDALRDGDPDTYHEVVAILTDILFIDSRSINAGSSFKAFGVVYLTRLRGGQSWTAYLEHLVHEAAHLHLFALWTIDSIIDPESEDARYHSPLRSHPRPMSGLIHAAFVLARTIRTVRVLSQIPRFAADVRSMTTSYNNAGNRASFEEKFAEAFDTIRKHARLTPFGTELMQSCYEMATNSVK